ncbi:DUF192 domain-containing protein [Lampropedia aestuarii]|uniref:DUF192 domain-containing protein n=1 Tax=Lampropedia aestuarii TaxID=2562762 RepID=A0A4S5BKX0_9BURK|nr:DUF192 domain-containing protein [Lampropedia aestuarii]
MTVLASFSSVLAGCLHKPLRKLSLAAGALAMSAAAVAQVGPQANGQPQMDLPRLDITSTMHRIDAQVAATPLQRQIGLMHRQSMPEHEGMLFVFETPNVQCFWMKNTLLPLSAAFVADDGRIVNLVDMQPMSTDSHCSTEPVRYVLEMNQGWFVKRGIEAGAHLKSKIFENAAAPSASKQ